MGMHGAPHRPARAGAGPAVCWTHAGAKRSPTAWTLCPPHRGGVSVGVDQETAAWAVATVQPGGRGGGGDGTQGPASPADRCGWGRPRPSVPAVDGGVAPVQRTPTGRDVCVCHVPPRDRRGFAGTRSTIAGVALVPQTGVAVRA